jgi:coenzyme F420-0:L-glutamate ligase/coenzyme F420-1:gamma-L-glutamate ligase
VKVELLGLQDIPEVVPGAALGSILYHAMKAATERLRNDDIIVVTQKIVSKAEGRMVRLSDVVPSPFATQWADTWKADARVVELVLRESRRVVRMDRGVLIVETHHGFVCANAGVDLSNIAGGELATLLPCDPDASARQIRDDLAALSGVSVGVVISDTFGRPWREGLTNVAIGTAGFPPLRSYVGMHDAHGLPLQATIAATADEIAAAAGLVSTKLNRIPAVLVRGLSLGPGEGSARDLLRAPSRDFFR